MTPPLPDSIYLEGQQYKQFPPLWVHKEDKESGVFLDSEKRPRLRTCATTGGCPAVFVLREPLLKVVLDMHWQFALAAWNYLMNPADVATELDYRLAFCNGSGLGKPGVPRRNYLKGQDLGAPENPRFDKDRTCARSKLTGTVSYSLALAITEVFQGVTPRRFREILTTNNVLRVLTMDGNQPPPLKPGKTYPQRVQDINPGDYLYNPRTHPWLFFAANTVASISGGGSRIYPFPRGAVYPWMGDGWKYTWFPHVARGTVDYPLSRLTKLQPGAPIPSAYRSN